jgi:hypothetical protein
MKSFKVTGSLQVNFSKIIEAETEEEVESIADNWCVAPEEAEIYADTDMNWPPYQIDWDDIEELK